MINKGMHKVTHTWSSLEALPHERKFTGKKKTPVDVKPELKSSAEQASTQRKSTNEEADLDEGLQMLPEPVKMRYIGPSDGAITHGQHIYALSSQKGTAGSGGAVKIDTGKMRCVVHKTHLEPVKEETKRIDEVSKEELRAMALAAAQKVQVTIDELSNKTMKSYVDKARVSSDNGDEKTVLKRNRGVKLALARAKKRFPEKFKEEVEQVNELSFKKLGDYRRASLKDSIKKLSTRGGNVENKEKLEKRKAGADLAWSKMGLSKNKPKVQSTEGEASARRSAEIHQAAMKNVKPSTQAMKDGVDKMGELARKSAHLFQRPKQPYAALKANPTHEEHQLTTIDELSRKILNRYVDKAIDDHGHKNFISRNIGGKENKKLFSDLAKKRAKGISRADDKLSGNVKVNAREEHHQFITDLQLAIESNGAHPVTFADGSRAAISPGYADRIIAKYETISEESKRNEFVSTISSNLKTLRESIKR